MSVGKHDIQSYHFIIELFSMLFIDGAFWFSCIHVGLQHQFSSGNWYSGKRNSGNQYSGNLETAPLPLPPPPVHTLSKDGIAFFPIINHIVLDK